MPRWLPLLIMAVGLGLAGSFGARLGDTQRMYRNLDWHADSLGADEAKAKIVAGLKAGKPTADARELALAVQAGRLRDDLGMPGPQKRLAEWWSVAGLGWLLGVLMIVLGAVMARKQIAAENAGTGTGDTSRVDFPGSVAAIVERLEATKLALRDVPMDDDAPALREALDAIRFDLIDPVVVGRGQLIARHGIGTFAEYFSAFSAGERLLNRAWSALTDGHAVVAREAVDASLDAFRQADTAWAAAEG